MKKVFYLFFDIKLATETQRGQFTTEGFALIKEQLKEEEEESGKTPVKNSLKKEEVKENIDKSTIPQFGENNNRELEDKDSTPKMANPVGFKRVKTHECFADYMEIPTEGHSPQAIPISLNFAKFKKAKRIESSMNIVGMVQPTFKLSGKLLPTFPTFADQ